MIRSHIRPESTLFRSKKNPHRYFGFSKGKLLTYLTYEKDFLCDLASLFSGLNGSFALRQAALTTGILGVFLSSPVQALPTGYESVSGNVQFSSSDSTTLNVTTTVQQSIANYQTFNVAQGETVNFFLPSAQSIILNRIIGGTPSEILGAINSNGQVWLVNPSGILFGKTAQINTSALLASTLNISDTDFLNGQYIFRQISGTPAAIQNQGQITTEQGGYAVFLGGAIANDGTISSPLGQIRMAVGEQVSLNVKDNVLIDVTVDQALQQKVSDMNDAISNTGRIEANGGLIKMQAELASDIYSRAVNNSGDILAQSVVEKDGVIELVANTGNNSVVENTGNIEANGSASNPNAGSVMMSADNVVQKGDISAQGAAEGTGGTIELLGQKLTLVTDNASIDTSGGMGGGTILLGGDYQGQGNTQTSALTYIGPDAVIKADATVAGDGGKVIVWADNKTWFYGDISAKGGLLSGNGGFVEVSGKQVLEYQGLVDATAPNGNQGTLLLDPTDVNILAAGFDTNLLTDVDQFADADLGAGSTSIDVASINAAGANVILQANQDINFLANVNIAGGGISITAEANRDINFVGSAVQTNNGDMNFLADFDGDGTGIVNIDAGSSLDPGVGTITLQGADIAISGSLQAGSLILIPSAPGSSIGIGGGAGTFNFGLADISNITALSSLTIGSAATTGNIEIGVLDLTAQGTSSLTINTTGTITDATSLADAAGSENIRMSTFIGSLTITGGGGTGSGQIGTAGTGDLDIYTGPGAVDDVVQLTVTTNNSDVFIEAISSPLTVASMNTGSGNITLAGADISDNDGAGFDDGIANITTTGTVQLTATTGNIGTDQLGLYNPIDVDAGAGASALSASATTANKYIRITETSGNISLGNISADSLTGVIDISATSGVATMTVPLGITVTGDDIRLASNGLTIDGTIAGESQVQLISDALAITGTVTASTTVGVVNLAPWNNASTIGLGGAAGVYTFAAGVYNQITTDSLTIGSETQSGDINIGSLDLSSNSYSLFLNTSGNIVDASAGDATANVILSANEWFGINGNFGGGSGNVGTAAVDGDLDVTTSGNGALYITSTADVNLQTTGTLIASSINTSGNLTLTGTNIIDDDLILGGPDDSIINIFSFGNMTLTATTGSIGTSTNDLDVDVSMLSTLKATALSGSIYIEEILNAQLTLDDITAAAYGVVQIMKPAIIELPVGKTITGSPIYLYADNLIIDGTINGGTGNVTLGPASGGVGIGLGGGIGLFNLTDAELSNIIADTLIIGSDNADAGIDIDTIDLTAEDYHLSLNSDGAITDTTAGADPTANIILAPNRNLSIGWTGGVGSGQVGGAGLADLDVTMSGTGLLSISTNNASIDLESTGGLVLDYIDSGTAATNLTATAGNITDGNGSLNNVVAGAGAALTASGVIGTYSAPLEIAITGGTITVTPGGVIGGVSVNINGSVAPVNALTVGGVPLGLVMFNAVADGAIQSTGTSSTVINAINTTGTPALVTDYENLSDPTFQENMNTMSSSTTDADISNEEAIINAEEIQFTEEDLELRDNEILYDSESEEERLKLRDDSKNTSGGELQIQEDNSLNTSEEDKTKKKYIKKNN